MDRQMTGVLPNYETAEKRFDLRRRRAHNLGTRRPPFVFRRLTGGRIELIRPDSKIKSKYSKSDRRQNKVWNT